VADRKYTFKVENATETTAPMFIERAADASGLTIQRARRSHMSDDVTDACTPYTKYHSNIMEWYLNGTLGY